DTCGVRRRHARNPASDRACCWTWQVAFRRLSSRPVTRRVDYITNAMEGQMRTTRMTSVLNGVAIGTSGLLLVVLGTSLDATRPVRKGGDMSTEQNKATARRWSEELGGQGTLATADEIIAADYVRHDPGDPFPARGPADVKRIVTMLRTMLPDFKIEVEALVAEGDMVVSRYTVTATDTLGYMGKPATGKTIRTSAMQMFRLDAGKIVESWAARDDLGTLRQLGHLPPMSPPPDITR